MKILLNVNKIYWGYMDLICNYRIHLLEDPTIHVQDCS